MTIRKSKPLPSVPLGVRMVFPCTALHRVVKILSVPVCSGAKRSLREESDLLHTGIFADLSAARLIIMLKKIHVYGMSE